MLLINFHADYCLNEIFFYILLHVIFIFLNLYLMVLDFTSMSTSDLLHYLISIDNIHLLPSSILTYKGSLKKMAPTAIAV